MSTTKKIDSAGGYTARPAGAILPPAGGNIGVDFFFVAQNTGNNSNNSKF
jgi:hypothetical protein